MNTITFERFSKKRFDKYTAEGRVFHIVNGSGNMCLIRAFDAGVKNKQCLVEETAYNAEGEKVVHCYYAEQDNGFVGYNTDRRLFFYFGPIFRIGELVSMKNEKSSVHSVFFWRGVRPADKEYIADWRAIAVNSELKCAEFRPARLLVKFEEDDEFCTATDNDTEIYEEILLEHRIIWAADGHFYFYPHVGDSYFEIFFENGRATFAQRTLETEDNRPVSSRLVMRCDLSIEKKSDRETLVRDRVRAINKALGYGEE